MSTRPVVGASSSVTHMGLFGTYALLAHNHVFGNYLLLSPSLWYDHKVCLKWKKNPESINKTKKQIIYMAIGGCRGSGSNAEPV